MFNKTTITIGIPTYNEEKNIKDFFETLKKQIISSNYTIKEIIFIDESHDDTPNLIKQIIKDNPHYDFKFIHNDKRMGAGNAWNSIFHSAIGDIIILLDADIKLDVNCISELAGRINDDTGLCASNTIPIFNKHNIFSNASAFIAFWLRSIRNYGLSQYTTMGRALAVKSRHVADLEIPKSMIAIDLYLQCKIIELKKNVVYNDKAVVYFATPLNKKDFFSQVIRSIVGHKQIKHISKKLNFDVPLIIVIKEFLKNSLKFPSGSISLILCYIILPYSYVSYKKKVTSLWERIDTIK